MLHLNYPWSPSLCSFTSIDIIIPQNRPEIIFVGKSKTRQEIKYSIIAMKTLSYSTLKQLIYFTQYNLSFQSLETTLSKIQINKKSSKIIKTQGFVGFIKFLQGYYLIYIQQAESVARIGKHRVKIIKKTNILSLFEFQNNETKTHEKRYLQLLRSYKLQNYYFSNTYDLTNSLFWNMNNYKQDQETTNKATQPNFSQDKSMHGFCEIFQWNYNLNKQFNQEIGRRQWIVPIIHGFCRQMNVKTRGTLFAVIIVSRRSRHHAGTRYIKRGINQNGFVANFVQTQQIVINCSSNFKFPNCSSFIQVRGSAPVYWMQQPNFVNPKPAIELVGSDPMFNSTKKHFSDLISHYGRNIFCVNLMKTVQNSPRQTILSAEYNKAVTLINQQFEQIKDNNRIHYMQTDYKANQKINKTVFMDKIKLLAYYCILKMGVNQCRTISRAKKQQVEFQNGVIRANCVDCLDRTNSFQQIIGQAALSIQIAKLMNQQIDEKTLTIDLNIFQNYGQIFQEMGDLISIQYGSSLAHKQEISKTDATRFQFMTSMTRHINNTFNDNERQQQIDLFLKIQVPQDILIWDLKPHITLFPSQTIRQKTTKYWQRRAINQFKKQINLQYYQKLSKLSMNNQKILNKVVKYIQKHDLVVIWSHSIADQMYADFEEQQYLFWIEIPPFLKMKNIRKLKTKLSIRKNLEQKLNQQYDKYQRKSSKIIQANEVVIQPELTVTFTQPSQYFNSILHPEIFNPQLNIVTKKSIRINDQIYEVNRTHPQFDQSQIIDSINNYLEYNVIDNEIISSDLALIGQNIIDPTIQIPSEHKVSEQQMSLIMQKINSMDFISQNKIQKQAAGTISPNERNRRRTLFIPVINKTIEDKKTEVLQEIITRHFSHGHKVGRIRII